MQAYIIMLYGKIQFEDGAKGLKASFDVKDQKKDFEALMPRILNMMASAELCPSQQSVVLDFQAENDYIPYVKMAATGKKGRKKGKIQRRVVNLQSGFRAPGR